MNKKSMLIEGLSDAIGFIGGALLGFWIGRLLGLTIFESGYSNSNIFGIVLIGLGGGLGLQVARRWRNRQTSASNNTLKK